MGRITDTVKTLLIINIVFFIGSEFLKARGIDANTLFALWFPKNPNFKIWQLVTHMFMHAPLQKGSLPLHLLFNMFNLYMFGSFIEQALGKNKFLFIYFSAGFGAVLLQLGINYIEFSPVYSLYMDQGFSIAEMNGIFKEAIETERYRIYEGISKNETEGMLRAYLSSMVGASGAISGLFMAFAVLYPNLPLNIMFIPVPIKAKYLIGGYFLMDLYFAVTGKSMFSGVNIAHWAHVGGAIVGFIIIWYWKKNSFNNKRWS